MSIYAKLSEILVGRFTPVMPIPIPTKSELLTFHGAFRKHVATPVTIGWLAYENHRELQGAWSELLDGVQPLVDLRSQRSTRAEVWFLQRSRTEDEVLEVLAEADRLQPSLDFVGLRGIERPKISGRQLGRGKYRHAIATELARVVNVAEQTYLDALRQHLAVSSSDEQLLDSLEGVKPHGYHLGIDSGPIPELITSAIAQRFRSTPSLTTHAFLREVLADVDSAVSVAKPGDEPLRIRLQAIVEAHSDTVENAVTED